MLQSTPRLLTAHGTPTAAQHPFEASEHSHLRIFPHVQAEELVRRDRDDVLGQPPCLIALTCPFGFASLDARCALHDPAVV